MFLNNTFRDIIKQIKNLCVSANIFEKIGCVGGGKILFRVGRISKKHRYFFGLN